MVQPTHRAVVRFLLTIGLLLAVAAPAQPAAAARLTSGGFTTSGVVSPSSVARGSTATITVSVTASTNRAALVDVEVYDGGGRKVVQQFWDAQQFTAGVARTYPLTWPVPANQATGTYRVDVGMFRVGWNALFHWNSGATSLRVTATAPAPTTTTTSLVTTTTTSTPATTTTTTSPATTTTTTSPATTTTARPTTTTTTVRPTTTTTVLPTTTTTVPPPTGRFVTLPPGSALPSDAQCAARVRPAAEIRPQNATQNAARGATTTHGGLYNRVTGNFTGTTDEIIQWTACKWGFDEDVVRAQTAKESWWTQGAEGDWGTNPSSCAPGHTIGADGRPGECPESFGVQQVRYPYWGWAFPHAINSTAYNLDAAFAARRNCFEGNETWLNQFERGRDYAAGDLWGCVGAWFSGRWYTPSSVTYIGEVQDYLSDRIWETEPFKNFRG